MHKHPAAACYLPNTHGHISKEIHSDKTIYYFRFVDTQCEEWMIIKMKERTPGEERRRHFVGWLCRVHGNGQRADCVQLLSLCIRFWYFYELNEEWTNKINIVNDEYTVNNSAGPANCSWLYENILVLTKEANAKTTDEQKKTKWRILVIICAQIISDETEKRTEYYRSPRRLHGMALAVFRYGWLATAFVPSAVTYHIFIIFRAKIFMSPRYRHHRNATAPPVITPSLSFLCFAILFAYDYQFDAVVVVSAAVCLLFSNFSFDVYFVFDLMCASARLHVCSA